MAKIKLKHEYLQVIEIEYKIKITHNTYLDVERSYCVCRSEHYM